MTIEQAQQLIQSAQSMAAQSSWAHVAIATVLGTVAGVPGQAIIEHWLAGPNIPARVKAIAPTALALGLGYLSTHFGITPTDAAAGATFFATAMHIYNETPLAAVSDPAPSVVAK